MSNIETTTENTIDNCHFVSERLWTDTRVWEVINRTPHTMTLRSTRRTGVQTVDMRCDEGAYGTRPVISEVEPNPNGHTITVRRRKDGGFGSYRPITGTPTEWTDYRY
jgi:hypothetical protein